MRTKKRPYWLLLVISVLATVFIIGNVYTSSLKYSRGGNERLVFEITDGESGASIADRLKSGHWIKSTLVFKIYLKQNNLETKIKSGRFVLNGSENMIQLIDTFTSNASKEMSVTLLEGWTVKQVADYLERSGLTSQDSFLGCLKTCAFKSSLSLPSSLEGYLFPDTYFVSPSTYSDQSFIQLMIWTLEKRITQKDLDAIAQSGKSFNEIMIMASIIEREERDPKERPTISGILWNRINGETGLYADATLLYALGRTKGGLSYEDLQVDSPFNTRKYKGLPPTPIGNPGLDSIQAAIYPEKTDYWYYLHDSDGNVHYARTLDEHNVNKSRYIK